MSKIKAVTATLSVFVYMNLIAMPVYGNTCEWEWLNPKPHGLSLHDGIHVADTYTVVGEGGLLETSTDLETWTRIDPGTTKDLNGIAWTGARYVVVGDAGTILTSADGSTWQAQESPVGLDLEAVVWAGGQLVAAGAWSAILTSPDGTTWTIRHLERYSRFEQEGLLSLAWDGSQYLAVGGDRRDSTTNDSWVLSSPDGITWARQVFRTYSGNLGAVAWNGSVFVTAGDCRTLLVSSDGQTWTEINYNAQLGNAEVYDLIWTGELFVAVGEGIFTSSDGTTWQQEDAPQSILRSTFWDGSRAIALGDAGAVVSRDSEGSWTLGSGTSGYQGIVFDLAATSFGYVAVGEDGVVLTSSDGETWSTQVLAEDTYLYAVAANSSTVVVVGEVQLGYEEIAVIFSSTDGIEWQRSFQDFGRVMRAVVWTGDQFFAGGAFTSADGIEWQRLLWDLGYTGEGGFYCFGEAVHGDTLLAVGGQLNYPGFFEPLIAYAADGEPLRRAYTLPFESGFAMSAASNSELVVAVGSQGMVLTSSSGMRWQRQESHTDETLRSVAWEGSRFVAVGDAGSVYSSADGILWIPEDVGSTQNLRSVVETGGELFLTGYGGTIRRRTCTPQDPAPVADLGWSVEQTPIGETVTFEDRSSGEPAAWRWDFGDGGWSYAQNPSHHYRTAGAYTVTLNAANRTGATTTSRAVTVEGDVSGCFTPRWSDPPAGGNELNDVVWGVDRFVAVGDGGAVSISGDGDSWSSIASPSGHDLLAVCWDGERFLAVGDAGSVITSDDGISWSGSSIAGAQDLTRVVYTGTRYLALAGNIIYSAGDDLEWQQVLSEPSWFLRDLAWNDDRMIVVGWAPFYSASRYRVLVAISEDGLSWNRVFMDINRRLTAAVWTGSSFIASAGDQHLVSDDGLSWQLQSAEIDNHTYTREMIVCGDRVLSVGGQAVLASSDGQSWTTNPLEIGSFRGLACSDRTVVAVGSLGSIAVSHDGQPWSGTAQSLPATNSGLWDAGQLILVGNGGAIFSKALSGRWRGLPSGTIEDLRAVASTGTRLVAVGDRGTVVVGQAGGQWQTVTSGTGKSLSDVAWNDHQLVAVGTNGTVLTSSDGFSWTVDSAQTAYSRSLSGVVWDGQRWFAVGTQGTVLHSENGISWTEVSSVPTHHDLNDVTTGNAHLVAVGESGTILFSEDGELWIMTTSQTTQDLSAVVFTGQAFVAVGDGGVVMTSEDGSEWTLRRGFTDLWDLADLSDVVWTGSQMVAIKRNGASLISSDGISWYASESTKATAIASNGSRYVAVGNGVLTSEDGIIWTRPPLSQGADSLILWDVVWAGDQFVAVGSHVLTSPDGEQWTVREGLTEFNALSAVIWNGSRLVAADGRTVYTSSDGTNWSETATLGLPIRDLAWDGERHVAVGDGGVIMASEDAASWTVRSAGHPDLILSAVEHDGQRFIAAGLEGPLQTGGRPVVMTSGDGLSWTRQEAGGFSSGIESLQVIDDGYLALRSSSLGTGNLLWSPDGRHWSDTTPGSSALSDLSWDGSRLVMAGSGILRQGCEEAASPLSPGAFTNAVPASAHVAGAAGTSWRSDLVLHNPNRVAANASLFFLELGRSNDGPGVPLTVDAGASLLIEDALPDLFSRTGTSGAILIGSELPLVVSSRTFNDAADGTYGQYIPGRRLSDAASNIAEATLIQLTQSDDYRTNLGIVNPFPVPVEVNAVHYRSDGSWLGNNQYQLQPFSALQDNNVLDRGAGEVTDAYTVLLAGSTDGRYLSYASVIDQHTGDPILVSPAVASPGELLVPAAAHVIGSNQADWRTDLEVVNRGATTARYRVELLASNRDNTVPAGQEFDLAASKSVRYQDVLHEMFAVAGTGALRVTPLAGQVLVSSRTYNQLEIGTYGQYIPAFPLTEAFAAGESARLVQLAGSSDSSSGFRTNIGMASAAAVPITIQVELLLADGTPFDTLTAELAPYAHVQLNDVFAGGGDLPGYALVRSDTPGALLFPYASVVDNGSGDPVFIPGQR